MQGLIGLARAIDAMIGTIGRYVAWAVVAAVAVSTINALVRYGLNTSSNAWLELQWVLFGAVFMLCAPWTLRDQEHIRIDILSGPLGSVYRSWMDLVGTLLFLIPFCLVMIYYSTPFFIRSLMSGEMSSSAGGLIVWPSKGLILLGFILLLAQAISELIKRLAVMGGHMPEYLKGGGHGAPADEAGEGKHA